MCGSNVFEVRTQMLGSGLEEAPQVRRDHVVAEEATQGAEGNLKTKFVRHSGAAAWQRGKAVVVFE